MSLAYAVLATWLLSGVAALALWVLLLRRLRLSHGELWLTLGSPTPLSNNTPSNNKRMLRFTWTREYLAAQDPVVARLVIASRIVNAVYLSAFTIIVVAILIGAVQGAAA